MKRIAHSTTIVLVSAFVLGLGLFLSPAAGAEGDGSFEGRFVLGYRDIDINGEVNKYREDINLGDGPRLMDLDFSLTPDGTLGNFVDRIQLDIDELGGEPFESIRLGVQKFGAYDFEYNRWESDYFYHDQLFPLDQFSTRNAIAGDFHTFDFRRVRDRASLDINLNERAALTFGFDRYSKTGESTTTLDISRDEFEFDRPIDEESFDYRVGFQYAWDKVTISIDERYREYDNAYEIFLPGQSVGDPGNSTVLDFYFLDQPYSFESWDHTLRVVAKPTDRFTVRASGMLQTLDLDLAATEDSKGVDFRGNPFAGSAAGAGEIDRDTDLFDLDLTYVINDDWALVGGYYVRSLDQEGSFLFDGVLRDGVWDIETDGFEAGIQWIATNDLSLTVGVRYESRDVEHGAAEDGPIDLEQETTDSDGYFGTLAWRPMKGLNFTLDYEDSSIDDPFTLAAPTDRSRLRATGRYTADNGFWLSGTYQVSEYENSASTWDAQHDLGSLRLGYNKDRLNAQLGYSVIEIDQAIMSDVNETALFNIAYALDSDFIDGMIRYRATGDFWIGGSFRLYENDGNFGVERDDYRVFGEYHFDGGYLVRLGYRTIDYDEADFDFDDYDADIIDFGVGLTW